MRFAQQHGLFGGDLRFELPHFFDGRLGVDAREDASDLTDFLAEAQLTPGE